MFCKAAAEEENCKVHLKNIASESKCASLSDFQLDEWVIPLECQRPSNKWITGNNPIFIYVFWHIIKTLSLPIPINMNV